MEKIFKKSLALILSAALCLTALVGCLTVSAADETTEGPIYEMIGANGAAGDTVTVTAKLQNLSEICAHHVKFTFAAGLDVISAHDTLNDKDMLIAVKGNIDGENYKLLKSTDTNGVTTLEDVNVINFVKPDGNYDEQTPQLEIAFQVKIGTEVTDGDYEVNVTAIAADQENEDWVYPEFKKAYVKVSSAPSHAFSAAWSYDKTYHWHACENHPDDAEDVQEKAEHTWNDGVVTTEPTLTAKGVKTFTCSVCGATKTEDVAMVAMQLSNYEYNHKNSAFNFRYTYGDDFKSIISAAKGYSDRKTEVILTLGGKEYSFETRVKTWDDLSLSGLTLNDLNSDIDLKLRLSYTKDENVCVFDTESYIINIADQIEQKYNNGQITDESELAVAKAYLDLNSMIKSNTEKIAASFIANDDQTTYTTSFSNGNIALNNSTLEFKYTHSDAFKTAISAAKDKNRVIFVVLAINGKEYSFETRPKTWDDLSLSGLTLADYNAEIKMFIRLKYTDNGSDVFVDSNSSTIKIADEIAKDTTTDFAKMFNAYNALLK